MRYTENEIIRSYNAAKDKKKQVDILAELCCCQKSEILDIIHKQEKVLHEEEQPQEEWREKILNQLYKRMDEVEKEIRKKEASYKELAMAIKVISELAG